MIVVTGAAIGGLAAVGWVVAVANSAPNLDQITPTDPHPLTAIYAADGALLGYVHSDTVFSYVTPGRIPQTLREATVAIEDRRFWQHGALDYQGILRAGIKDVFSGDDSLQGASTLTMQLVNNMYMPTKYAANHDLRYKIVQAKLAEQLEGKHSKSWILDMYLNDVPYGTVDGATAQGVGAASQMFFNKPVWKLDLAQQALLAGLPQSPTDYNPFYAAPLAMARRNEVLQAMATSHYITTAQAAAAERKSLQVKRNMVYTQRSQQYVFDYAESQLIQHYGLKAVETGGLKAYTTIDAQMQYDARDAILSHQPGGPVLDDQPAAALATIDPANGHILALGSSATYAQTNFDYPVQALRQPGSAFKVFALMTLIHDYHGDPNQTYYVSKFLPAGWLPEDPTWSVHTAEETYQGTINVTKATVVSDNTVFAQLAADLGWRKLDATAHAMGITSPLDGNPAEVIGGLRVGVTPLEMADAYATLANGGTHIAPTIIDHVVFPNGSVDTSIGNPPKTQVFSYGEAYAAIQVLKGVITTPGATGTAAGYGCPAAGKTGTAENMDNAWFVGFTPKLSTAVWVGYPQGNIPMSDGFGGTLAAPIWHDFMEQASDGYCGDWASPTVPFQGTAYFGARAVTGNSGVGDNTGAFGIGSQTGAGSTATIPYDTVPAPTPQPLQQQPQSTGTSGNGATTGAGGAKRNPTGGGGTGPARRSR
ncbi:MAG: transglycosylase domain-containing protein [Solirubrobacteraceae bacterium]